MRDLKTVDLNIELIRQARLKAIANRDSALRNAANSEMAALAWEGNIATYDERLTELLDERLELKC